MITKRKFLFSVFCIIGAIVLSVVAVKALCEKWQEKTMDTDALFFTSLEDMQQWGSCRYNLEAELQLNNYKIAKTVINGERDVDGNLHICGEIMDTKIVGWKRISSHRFRNYGIQKGWTRCVDDVNQNAEDGFRELTESEQQVLPF